VETRSASGAVVATWEDFRTVWAAVIPLRGEKFFNAQQLQAKYDTTIRVRYQPGYRITQRIKYEKEPGLFQIFEILAAPELNERRFMIDFLCVLRESDGFRGAP
jgi:SPP1 family predicted phage head-tail adaptor